MTKTTTKSKAKAPRRIVVRVLTPDEAAAREAVMEAAKRLQPMTMQERARLTLYGSKAGRP